MKKLPSIITCLCLATIPALAAPPTVEQWELRQKGATGMISHGITWADGQVIVLNDGAPSAITLNAAAVGLGSVENTAVSTWAGSANITTLGTITTGTWNATAIALGKIAQGGATSGQVLSWDGSAWAATTLNAAITSAANTFSETQTLKSLRLGSTDGAHLRDRYEAGGDASAKGSLTMTSDGYGVSLVAAGTIDSGGFRTGGAFGSPYHSGGLSMTGGGKFEIRNGSSSTALMLHNTFTSDTNHEAIGFDWQSNVARVGTVVGGSGGTARDWLLQHGGVEKARVTSGGLNVYDKLTVNKAGYAESGGIEVDTDPMNGSVRAISLLPPENGGRLAFGKTGQGFYALNFGNVSKLEFVPGFETATGFHLGLRLNTFIDRGDGGTEIGANHPGGYGFDVFQDDSYAVATIAHRALNVHREGGLTIFGSSTTRTNYEGLNLRYDGTRYIIRPVAGSGGGTVQTVRYHLTETVWIGSGSGTPEAVETAGVGSIYTDTATGDVYRKTSGSGNTGWVTP